MTKVDCILQNELLRSSVCTEVLDSEIDIVVPVYRPLDIPNFKEVYGTVLSHSGMICTTVYGPVLVEFMNTNQIFIYMAPDFSLDRRDFRVKHFYYHWHGDEPQHPNKKVTIRQFCEKMTEFTVQAEFNTFTHNCHHARNYVMQKYGMHSIDPDVGTHNTLFQGVIDYVRRST